MTMGQDRLVRKWEIFQGRNQFYCKGRCMTAPSPSILLFTVTVITATSITFFIFDCKYLAQNVTIAIPIIGVILYLFTMSALLRTSLTDPGIIPRATTEEAAYVEKQIEVTNSANSPTYRPPPRTKEVLINGQTIKLKYCFTCKLFRPPRASHCSICDNCVDRFDHHCPWVGNCVGRRNYRFFYMFIVSLAFLAVFIFACSLAHLILMTRENIQFLDAIRDSPASVVVAVICFFSVWSILGLAGFHTYLTTSNQTTNEDIKGSFTNKRGEDNYNPYSHGNICLNCFHILCGPLTPSLIDRRGIVTDRYRREIFAPVITLEPPLTLANYGIKAQNSTNQYIQHNNLQQELPGIYRQTNSETTTTATENNTGSITHLVTSEHPLAIAPVLQRLTEDSGGHYKSHPTLLNNNNNNNNNNSNNSPVYNNITTTFNHNLSKSQSYTENINLPSVGGTLPLTTTTLTSSKSTATAIIVPIQQNNELINETKLQLEDLHLDPIVLRENHILTNINNNERTKFPEIKLDNDLTLPEKENNLLSASRLKLLQDTTMIESALDLDSLEDSSVGTNSQAGLMKVIV